VTEKQQQKRHEPRRKASFIAHQYSASYL
jgi:hypothetical protein